MRSAVWDVRERLSLSSTSSSLGSALIVGGGGIEGG
jgi:hypothetical protein